jgi:hypothetical protein
MSNQKITILTDEVRRLRKENSRLRMLMINYGPSFVARTARFVLAGVL